MKMSCLLFLVLSSLIATAQEDAWVYFNSKPNQEVYYENPLLMLSQRAIDRRIQQNIAIDIKDVPISQGYIDQVSSVEGINVMAKSKWLNAIHVRGSFESISSLLTFDFVDSVDFADDSLDNFGRPSQSRVSIQNISKATQVFYPYGNSENQVQMLNGHLLHEQDKTGSGKIIAVLDAGFPGVDVASPFQRLHDQNLILGGYNFVNRTTNFYSGGNHGTLVLSVMGGYLENQLVGTAPDASYYLFVTEDITSETPLEESLWVEAAEMADSLGVDIINTSLGYFNFEDSAYSHTYQDMDGQTTFISRGANIANSRGMVVVVSAGNSGGSSNPNISAPADAPGVLTVGAVTALGQYASFSSLGPAFGGNIKPDVMAQGEAATIADGNGGIGTANGTSFSAPIIAGMVACLWQALPDKSAEEIKQLIRQSASFYTNPNEQFGYGIPDFGAAASLGDTGIKKDATVVFFPNPFKEQINVSFGNGGKGLGSIVLYNAFGQEVLHQRIGHSTIIHTDGLIPGVYFYKLITADGQASGKLIKQ